MADTEDLAKKNAKAYQAAADSYAKAMEAEAKKKTAEGAAVAQAADAAQAPTISTARGPAQLTDEQRFRLGMGGVPAQAKAAAAAVPESVQNYQDTIEAKRAGMTGYDPRAAALAVPPEVDKYQAQIEAPRVEPGHSLGEPIPETTPLVAVEPEKPAEPKKMSAIDKIIADLKAETKDEKGPNIWDIIQAAAAGWNFQPAAYAERKKAAEAKKADIEKLTKTAEFERALQEERSASEMALEKSREANALKLAGMVPLAAPGMTKGQALGAGLMKGLGSTKPIPIIPTAPIKPGAGGAH